MRRIPVRERRARLARRHHLARPADTPEATAADLVGLHSSDPTTVYLSAWARIRGFVPADLEDAMYRRRSLVRMLGARRTLFVVPVVQAAVMDEACTKALAPRERERLTRMLEDQGVAPVRRGARWLDGVVADTLAALASRGEATARELTQDVPELGTKLSFGEGTTWAGTMGVSTRVLFLLAAEGRAVRTRPLGSWTSGQYRWATTDAWLGGPLAAVDHDEACADLLRRWLRAFGPATAIDIRWWTGWTAALATRTLDAIGAVPVRLGRVTGYVLSDDLDPVDEPDPWVALLPSLDPTIMGWKERAWYVGHHAADLFDRNGNAGPTVWVNGRAIGTWAQTEDGRIVTELLGRPSSETRERIRIEGERLEDWLGDVRIRPRFMTSLGRSLVARSERVWAGRA